MTGLGKSPGQKIFDPGLFYDYAYYHVSWKSSLKSPGSKKKARSKISSELQRSGWTWHFENTHYLHFAANEPVYCYLSRKASEYEYSY